MNTLKLKLNDLQLATKLYSEGHNMYFPDNYSWARELHTTDFLENKIEIKCSFCDEWVIRDKQRKGHIVTCFDCKKLKRR